MGREHGQAGWSMSAKRMVGRIPMEVTAHLPGGEPFKLTTVHLDLVATAEGATGAGVYTIGADLQEIARTIRTIFEAHDDLGGEES